MHPASRIALATTTLLASILVAGCGAGSPATTTSPLSVHMSGSVYGGRQPIIGAAIQLYTVGTSAAPGAGTSTGLIPVGTTVLTDNNGSFSITGDYSCTNATQVYIVARGGDPGSGTNSNSALATALGSCATLLANANTSFININELTTVAAAYALGPFHGSSYVNISGNPSYNTGTVGLPNAMLTAALLTSPTPPAGITLPTSELNTLANILAACVNTNGSGSDACSKLYTATGATNTFDAAFAIAKNPTSSAILALAALSTSASPYQPSLAGTPKDFTVAVKYAPSLVFNGPTSIAIDAGGNALITQPAANSVVAVSPLNGNINTAINVGSLTLNNPQGIAVDTNGSVWIANTGGHNIAKIAPYANSTLSFPTAALSYYALTPGVSNPINIASDKFGDAYTVSSADSKIFAVGKDGTITASASYPDFATATAFSLSGAQTLFTGSSTGRICYYPFVANATVLSFYNSSATCVPAGSGVASISAVNYSGALGGAPEVGTGTSGLPIYNFGTTATLSTTPSVPSAIAADASGVVYIPNNGALYAFTYNGTALSPTGGFSTPLSTPKGVDVDPSGNVWVTDAGDNSVTVFVGLANATVTPLAANLH